MADNSGSKPSLLKRVLRKLKSLIIGTTILGLVASNIATLINDEFHNLAFNALKTSMTAIMEIEAVSEVLRNSPVQKFVNLQNSHKFRLDTAKRISKRISRRAVLNASKNIASIPLEVIPALGVATIAALTASDIYDNCQNIKDMNELALAFEIEEKNDENTVCGMQVPEFP